MTNNWIGQHVRFNLFLCQEICTKCNKCVLDCPNKALSFFAKKVHKKLCADTKILFTSNSTICFRSIKGRYIQGILLILDFKSRRRKTIILIKG